MNQKTTYYLPQLDGLRLVAFLLVFVVHSPWPSLSDPTSLGGLIGTTYVQVSQALGNFGVDLFFCLSAFLITRILLLEFDTYGSFSIPRFILRRILRIWPLYYLILALGILVIPAVVTVLPGLLRDPSFVIPIDSPGEVTVLKLMLAPYLLFIANNQALIVGSPGEFLAPLWSISLEEQFYVLWPFVLFYFLTRGTTLKGFIAIPLMVIVFTTLVKLYFIVAGFTHPYIWLSSMTRLDAFATGAIVAFKDRSKPGTLLFGIAQPVVGAAIFGLNIVLPSPFLNPPHFLIPVSYLSAAIGFALILDYLVTERRSLLSRVLATRPIVFLGRISYGLYVFHMLGIYVVQLLFDAVGVAPYGDAMWILFTLSSFSLTAAVAAASYYLYERRFLALKDRLGRVRKLEPPGQNPHIQEPVTVDGPMPSRIPQTG